MSEADIIYSHISNEEIQQIKPSSEEMVIRYINKVKSMSLEAVIRRENDN